MNVPLEALTAVFDHFVGAAKAVVSVCQEVGQAVQDFINEAAGLKRLSDITGESVENLSAWKQAIDAAGMDGSAFLGTVKGVTENINNLLASGTSGVAEYLKELGVEIYDANGKLRNTTDILLDVAGAWDGYTSDQKAKIIEQLGLDEGAVRVLQLGKEKIGSLLETQKAQGVITAEQAESAERLNAAFAELKVTWETTANTLIADLMPAIEVIVDCLIQVGKWVNESKPVLHAFMLGLITILMAVGATLLAIILPVLTVIFAAITALGGYLYFLYGLFMFMVNAGAFAISMIAAAFDMMVEALGRALQFLGDSAQAVWRALVGAWDAIAKLWDESIEYLKNRWQGMSLSQIAWDIISSLADSIKNAWDTYVVPFFTGIDGQFKEWFGFSLIDTGSALITSLLDGVRNIAATIDQTIEQSVVGPIYKWLKGLADDAYSFAGSMITRMIDAFGEKVATITDAFKGGVVDGLMAALGEFDPVPVLKKAIDAALAYLDGVGADLLAAGERLIDKLTGGILSKQGAVAQSVGGAINDTLNFLGVGPGTSEEMYAAALGSGMAKYSNMSSTTNIGRIDINVPNGDPAYIGRGVGHEIQRVNDMATYADGGRQK